MSRRGCMLLILLGVPWPCAAQGIFPVYETGGHWVVFDGKPTKTAPALSRGMRLLVIGSRGVEIFSVAGSSVSYGGGCRDGRPVPTRTVLLKGPRHSVGQPIIGIKVAAAYRLRGRPSHRLLSNEVGEADYARLLGPLKRSILEDVKAGKLKVPAQAGQEEVFWHNLPPGKLLIKIDFGSRVGLRGLAGPFVFIEETEIFSQHRRCLRLSDGPSLRGSCEEMPRKLMAETALLQFVSYDPKNSGKPFLLAFTPSPPLWGDERWGFILNAQGPKLFLMHTMDVRCRESF